MNNNNNNNNINNYKPLPTTRRKTFSFEEHLLFENNNVILTDKDGALNENLFTKIKNSYKKYGGLLGSIMDGALGIGIAVQGTKIISFLSNIVNFEKFRLPSSYFSEPTYSQEKKKKQEEEIKFEKEILQKKIDIYKKWESEINKISEDYIKQKNIFPYLNGRVRIHTKNVKSHPDFMMFLEKNNFLKLSDKSIEVFLDNPSVIFKNNGSLDQDLTEEIKLYKEAAKKVSDMIKANKEVKALDISTSPPDENHKFIYHKKPILAGQEESFTDLESLLNDFLNLALVRDAYKKAWKEFLQKPPYSFGYSPSEKQVVPTQGSGPFSGTEAVLIVHEIIYPLINIYIERRRELADLRYKEGEDEEESSVDAAEELKFTGHSKFTYTKGAKRIVIRRDLEGQLMSIAPFKGSFNLFKQGLQAKYPGYLGQRVILLEFIFSNVTVVKGKGQTLNKTTGSKADFERYSERDPDAKIQNIGSKLPPDDEGNTTEEVDESIIVTGEILFKDFPLFLQLITNNVKFDFLKNPYVIAKMAGKSTNNSKVKDSVNAYRQARKGPVGRPSMKNKRFEASLNDFREFRGSSMFDGKK